MKEMKVYANMIVFIKGTDIRGKIVGADFDEETVWVSFGDAEGVLMRWCDVETCKGEE